MPGAAHCGCSLLTLRRDGLWDASGILYLLNQVCGLFPRQTCSLIPEASALSSSDLSLDARYPCVIQLCYRGMPWTTQAEVRVVIKSNLRVLISHKKRVNGKLRCRERFETVS
jgi:hypothetical protein